MEQKAENSYQGIDEECVPETSKFALWVLNILLY